MYRYIHTDSLPKPTDSLTLAIVRVSADRLIAPLREDQWSPDETYTDENVADWLSRSTGVFVRSYGLGSLATTSVRGGAAGHIAISWNGLPLENPMLGLTDLSLFPRGLFSSASLRTGGQSAGWGSGAVAGLLRLEDTVPDATGYSIETTVGSFGFAALGGKGYFVSPDGKWAMRTRIRMQRVENDFSYQLRPGADPVVQSHAAQHQIGATQELTFRPAQNEEITARFWLQRTDREIPPTTVQNASEATQEDASARLSIGWEKTSTRTHQRINAGFFRESIDYRDPLFGGSAYSVFSRLLLEMEHQQFLGESHRLLVGLSGQSVRADIISYSDPAHQIRLAPFFGYRYTGGNLMAEFNWRQETVDGRFLPPVPALSVAYTLTSAWSLKTSLSRNYRLPTLNDLYWRPGGNPNLSPESGWSREIGIAYRKGSQHLVWWYSLTAYHRRLRNWIQWAPAANAGFWSASNLTRVRSRGVEQRGGVKWLRENGDWSLEVGHDFVESQNEVEVELPRMRAGEQLWYVPQHQAKAAISIKQGKWGLRYGHRWTSSVRAISGVTLDGYQLGQISLSFAGRINDHRIDFTLGLENLWDVDYRVVERRAMPGRHWRLSVRWLNE